MKPLRVRLQEARKRLGTPRTRLPGVMDSCRHYSCRVVAGYACVGSKHPFEDIGVNTTSMGA